MNRRTAVGVLGSLAFGAVAAAWGRRALAQPVWTMARDGDGYAAAATVALRTS